MTYHAPANSGQSTKPAWIASLAVIVVAVVVTLVVVLNAGGGSTRAGSAPTSPAGTTADTAPASTDTASTGSASPTSDAGTGTALPTSGSSVRPTAGYTGLNCPPGEKPSTAVIDLTVSVGFVEPGNVPPSNISDVFAACTTPAVAPRLTELYGLDFHTPDGDLTGNNDMGPVGRFRMVDDTGGILTITVAKTPDNRYVCTDFAYRRG